MKKLMLVVALVLGACSHNKTTTTSTPTAQKTLYERLGGKPAIEAVIDDFLGNVKADDRINARFANADVKHLREALVTQVCQATGGPCQYTGKSMEDAHKGMNITDDEFGALVDDLKKSLDKLKVPDKEQGELLSTLGGLKGQIVGK